MFDEALLEQRLKDFKPEPLVTPIEFIDEPIEIHTVKEDENNIDLAKVNYLDFLNNDEIKKASEAAIRQYGVGTCGPRAFYGTTEVHLELEEALAKFLHRELSITYSCGFVAISSSIAAYCKKNDVVFVDERTNFAIRQGLAIAKSKVVKFAHNDHRDFERKVQNISRKETQKSRKLLVIEGVSWNTGKLCPLPDFLKVAEIFKIRVFLDESYTLGVFGETGRGLTEYFNIDPDRIDMQFGTLEGAIGSVGGFSAGNVWNIRHQQVYSAGFAFSASPPTYLVEVVIKGLELLGDKPQKFAKLTKTFHKFLDEECRFNVVSHPESPFKLINIDPKINETKVYKSCKENGVHFIHNENGLLINLNVNLLDNMDKLERVYQVLKEASYLVN